MEENERYEITSFEINEFSVIFDNNKHQIILTLDNYCYQEICELVNLLNQQDKEIKQLKEQLSNEEQSHDLCIKSFEEETEKLKKQIKFESEARERFKQSQNEKENEILKKVVDFINELAWHDVKYDAFQSTVGEFPASPSAIPRYAKKYFNLWKEMFNENLEDKIKNWEQNNGRIYKK